MTRKDYIDSKVSMTATFRDMHKHLEYLEFEINSERINPMWEHNLNVYCKYVEWAVERVVKEIIKAETNDN